MPSPLSNLQAQPSDPILGLMGIFRADQRPNKLDLGVGVYRNADGQTPVLTSVKQAEEMLLREQPTKAYLAPEGDALFCALLADMLVRDKSHLRRMAALQTPGGSGALRVAADIIASASPGCRIFIGEPTWPNHSPLLGSPGVRFHLFPGFDVPTQSLLFENHLAAIAQASAGDVFVLQAGCHNPTGADFTAEQWQELAKRISEQGMIALLDMAYHGWGQGQGLDADGACVESFLSAGCPTLLAYSCDKNFGLYRERVGALFVFCADEKEASILFSNMVSSARATWSMPPDHGAAIVRTILQDPALTALWRSEVAEVQQRIAHMREELVRRSLLLDFIGRQNGLFSLLPVATPDILALRESHAIYLPNSGRMNVAGLNASTIDYFVEAITPILMRCQNI